MKAIILAGGRGERLRPLTCDNPKPMVPVLDIPAIGHIVGLLSENGVDHIGVALHYLPGKIKSYLQELAEEKYKDIRFDFFVEEHPLGTAGCVKYCIENIKDLSPEEDIIIISGDAVTDTKLIEAAEYHASSGAKATVIVKKVKVPVEYGVVNVDEHDNIIGFTEKPSWGHVTGNLINTGMYIIKAEILDICNETGDFAKDIFPKMIDKHLTLKAWETKDYWCDIGNPLEYLRSNRDMLEGKVTSPLVPPCTTEGIWIGTNTIVSEKAMIISPSYIGDNCLIEENVVIDGSVIGNGCVIKRNSKIKGSVFGHNCKMDSYGEVTDSIIARDCYLKGNSGIDNAVLGERCRTGVFSLVRKGAKLWPGTEIQDYKNAEGVLKQDKKGIRLCYDSQKISSTGEYTPEFMNRLGASYGSFIGRGAVVAVCCDGSGAASMMTASFAAGLASTGVMVKYSDSPTNLSVLRWACRKGVWDGGFYGEYNKRENITNIYLLNCKGNDLDSSERRKLKNIFASNDYLYVNEGDILPMGVMSEPEDFYIADMLSIFDAGQRPAGDMSYKLDRSQKEAVCAYLTAIKYPEAPLFVSASSMLAAEDVAGKFDRHVIHCDGKDGDIMGEMEKYMHIPGVYPQYLMLFDPFAFQLAVSQLADTPGKIRNLLWETFPKVFKMNKIMKCDEEKKMRVITYFTGEQGFDVWDGLVRRSGEGAVRIYPEEEENGLRVFVESFDEEYAKEMMAEVEKKLEKILQ